MFIQLALDRKSIDIPKRITGINGRSYSIEDQLGQGGNSVVFECSDEADGSMYAVKFLTNSPNSTRGKRFTLEASLLKNLSDISHDHLVRFITSGNCKGTLTKSETTKLKKSINVSFIVMERAKCSLREYVKNSYELITPEIYVAQFRGLVNALKLLHQHALHRDIKPDNILVIGERWVISDLGLCTPIEETDGEDLTPYWQIPGPRFWMSPEANNQHIGLDDAINYSSDIFQLASVFWWVVNRRHPSGILIREDWKGLDSLFAPIHTALQHSQDRRYKTADEFSNAVVDAISL